MSARTEKKLENLENDVIGMEAKYKEFAERLRLKKVKTEETRNLAIVEIVRENNVSIGELKKIISDGGKQIDNAPLEKDALSLVQTVQTVTSATEKSTNRKEQENEEIY